MKTNNDEDCKYGYDQFGYPISKEDVQFGALIGGLMGLVFVVGLLLV